jgi:hypothetical protein
MSSNNAFQEKDIEKRTEYNLKKIKDFTQLEEQSAEKVKNEIITALNWDTHKPFVVHQYGSDGKKKINCFLNAGVHQCIVHFIPPDKKNKKDIVDQSQYNDFAIRCNKVTKLVGVDMNFYRTVEYNNGNNSVTARSLNELISLDLIKIENSTGIQHFCHKHLASIFGAIPRQSDSNSLNYNLFACAPFFAGDVIATFSQIRFLTDDGKKQKGADFIDISPVSMTDKQEINSNEKTDDRCIRDLGDYISDPRSVFLPRIKTLKKSKKNISKNFTYNVPTDTGVPQWVKDKCNVKIQFNNNKYAIVAIKDIYGAPGKENEVQLFADFGDNYWTKMNALGNKTVLKHYRNRPVIGYGDPSSADSTETALEKYSAELDKHLLGNFESNYYSSTKAKKLKRKRLNTLELLLNF